MKSLGGEIVEDFSNGCTHLITNKIRLTNKFLCGISLAKHIVDIGWIDESKRKQKFVKEDKFLLKDEENESKWNFSLKNSINKSHREKILSRFSVFVTPKTLSLNPFIRDMIIAHSGSFLDRSPSVLDPFVLVISSKDELTLPLSQNLSSLGYKFYHLEVFFLFFFIFF